MIQTWAIATQHSPMTSLHEHFRTLSETVPLASKRPPVQNYDVYVSAERRYWSEGELNPRKRFQRRDDTHVHRLHSRLSFEPTCGGAQESGGPHQKEEGHFHARSLSMMQRLPRLMSCALWEASGADELNEGVRQCSSPWGQ